MTMATVLPSKSSGTFVARMVFAFAREVGHKQGDVTVKSDQEEAMKAIITDVGRVGAAASGGRMVVMCGPVAQSQSNGAVERGKLRGGPDADAQVCFGGASESQVAGPAPPWCPTCLNITTRAPLQAEI